VDAYAVYGKPTTGTVDLAALGAAGMRIDGAVGYDPANVSPGADHAGYAVSAADVNGDSKPDVLVNAPGAGNNSRSNSGSTYVIFGPPPSAGVDLSALGTGGYRIDGATTGEESVPQLFHETDVGKHINLAFGSITAKPASASHPSTDFAALDVSATAVARIRLRSTTSSVRRHYSNPEVRQTIDQLWHELHAYKPESD
jgi:hypothetical protein